MIYMQEAKKMMNNKSHLPSNIKYFSNAYGEKNGYKRPVNIKLSIPCMSLLILQGINEKGQFPNTQDV